MSWTWVCHLCRSHYPLGATRRCLIDGHRVCRGRTVSKDGKTTRHHRSCRKEFDYLGWRVWGRWRQHKNRNRTFTTYKGRNCLHQCDFPTECMGESGHSDSNVKKPGQTGASKRPIEEVDEESWIPRSQPKRTSLNLRMNVAAVDKLPLKVSSITEDVLKSLPPPSSGGASGLGITVRD